MFWSLKLALRAASPGQTISVKFQAKPEDTTDVQGKSHSKTHGTFTYEPHNKRYVLDCPQVRVVSAVLELQ